jgi:hypothetical protein
MGIFSKIFSKGSVELEDEEVSEEEQQLSDTSASQSIQSPTEPSPFLVEENNDIENKE